MIDVVGPKQAQQEIAMIKVAAPRMALRVVDRAIQAHGGGGVSQDHVLAHAYAGLRSLRLADGPDEVHCRTVARIELNEVKALREFISNTDKSQPAAKKMPRQLAGPPPKKAKAEARAVSGTKIIIVKNKATSPASSRAEPSSYALETEDHLKVSSLSTLSK